MTKKCINGGIVADVKDESGNWRKVFRENYVQYRTISYVRWDAMRSRCLIGGRIQSKHLSYIGVTNKFKDFNSFVEWSHKQVGYDVPGYELDKDLLIKGNKIYSPETCVFLPSRINTLMIKCNASRGDFPIGVSSNKHGKFNSRCRDSYGKPVYLGLYVTPEEAFIAYKIYKESILKQVAEEYKDVIDIRAYNALMSYSVEIND